MAYNGEERIQSFLDAAGSVHMIPGMREASLKLNRVMFRKLVQAAGERLADDPDQYWVSCLLSMAPEELRDPELGLKLARRSFELAPDGDNPRVHLGWALFRAGEWQACVDTLPAASPEASDSPQSILTMALWQLGRRDEAQALFERAEGRLEKYVKMCEERDGRGVITLPTAAMMKRLHSEAAAMLERTSPSDE